jgi:hypothetical protein
MLDGASIGALAAAAQTPRTALREPCLDVVLTDALRRQIADVLARDKVPGYALALVRPDAATPAEYANWGSAAEESNVCARSEAQGRPPRLVRAYPLAFLSKNALSHVSGLPRHDYSYSRGQTAADLLNAFPHLRAAHELCTPSTFRFVSG